MKTLLLVLTILAFALPAMAVTVPSVNPYMRIQGMTPAERRDAMEVMSSRDVASIWREQFRQADVNLVQREFLTRFVNDLPNLIGHVDRVKVYEAEAAILFPMEQRAIFSLDATYLADCTCNVGSDFNLRCPVCSSYTSGPSQCPNGCNYYWIGCGFADLMPCDGFCGRMTKTCGVG